MDVLRDKSVVIRKPHRCFGCGRGFPKGTVLRHHVAVDAGDFCHGYWCPVCEEILSRNTVFDDGISEGDHLFGDPEEFERTRLEIEGAIHQDDWRREPTNGFEKGVQRLTLNAIEKAVNKCPEAEEKLAGKCNWEKMTRRAVLIEWGDPRSW